ncbi:GNAT family N-acetyltransferase [Ramlibacter sp. PS4R-6]|uniref:GNAT family N-acetyltransferase n=1 Tax=Ramlibacter sp. PS4R-6 TaxID=3133438 RepID=UPI0030A9A900
MLLVPTLRLATLRDARAIADMSREQVEAGLAWSWTPERVRASIRDRATNVVVAMEGIALVGFGIMKYGDDKAHLSLLAVSPSQRDHGVGGKLLDWLEKSARTAGIERIELEARADNLGALAFYGMRGYERYDIAHGYYQGRIDAYRLAKSLA